MTETLATDKRELEQVLAAAREQVTDVLTNLDRRPPGVVVEKPKQSALPEAGMGARRALELFQQRYLDQLSGSAGPRYFGFVTGGATPAALVGDWLASAVDQNVHTVDDGCAPFVELETIGFLRELFGLPEAFTGSFVSGATMSNFVGLATARQKIARDKGVNVADDGLWQLPAIRVFAATGHSSVFKALSMLGMGRKNLEQVPCLDGREAIDTTALAQYLKRLDGVPAIVVASAGTVNTVDFDDFQQLAELKRELGFWLHVDAAFGGFAACSPEHVHLVAGWEHADSITVDAHKWLNVPYDSAMQFTRHLDLQLEVFQNQAPYLATPALEPHNYIHLTPENSRRFRALPAWMTLMAYGRDGYREIVERNCALARQFGDALSASPDFRLLAPTRLNVVCFTVIVNGEPATSEFIKNYLERIKKDGRAYLSASVYKGTPAIRAAVCNWRTQASDIEIALRALQESLPT